MIDFSELSAAEAQAYCDAYSAAAPERAAWLRDVVRRTGGPELDGTPHSLGPLWRWYLGWLRGGGRTPDAVEGLPPWHADRPNKYLSNEVLWVNDAIACYFGEVVRAAVPGAAWDVFSAPKRLKHVKQHRTVLTGLADVVDPVTEVYGLTIGMVVHGEASDPDALVKAYREAVA